jgi:histidine phosphotransferase ChpT
MQTDLSLRLAEHISSRLCHDLITPIGAINTGLELFQENPADHLNESDEILNLILHSAQTASARLSFFRVAFGSSGTNVSLGEARLLAENCFLRSKLEFHWAEPFDANLALGGWGRLLLNAILWLSECAPRGGKIEVSSLQGKVESLSLILKADSIIIHQGTLEAMEGKATVDELTPRTVGCYLIRSITDEMKGKLTVHKSEAPSELSLEIKSH